MILDDVDTYLGRFVAFPSDGARHAVTLWAAHTHLYDCFDSTPRLVLSSPEKQSGKTRCLEVLDLIVANAMPAGSISPAALVRSLAEKPTPTVLLDEYDAVFGGPIGRIRGPARHHQQRKLRFPGPCPRRSHS